MNKKNQIICVGSSCKDTFFPTGDGVVVDTPSDLLAQKKIYFELGAKYKVDQICEAPGGCAANVAQGLARLEIDAGALTKIGGDLVGKWIVDELKKENVDVEFVQIDKKCRTDLSSIIVDTKTKDHIIFWNRDSNEKLEISSEKIPSAEWIFVSALNGNWRVHLDIIIEMAKKKDMKIALNPGQKNIHDDAKKVLEAIKNSQILILNKDEAIEIISESGHWKGGNINLNNEKFLLKEFLNLGCSAVVITDGNRGAWGSDGKSNYFCPGIKVDTVDTLGAGDAFTSGFLAAYLKEKDIQECLRWGAANGSNVAKFYGAKNGLLRINEIEARIENIEIKIF
ncbi:MAG: Carbohydrate kinase [Candidatus Moranbacteria bacterium GW2011_GWE2_35_2-]|nr:MAG: Carbohydrate kinase [Candidatus Moranbacteria bacterium GW2011_GWE2_35_2-]KKQ06850.1 MAG: Carbohydrate kinase [Candidatus Moranbacteria bacterium GW2011_GWF1_36_4]KKQ22399.1 MAG: Carbohydrate kinase [Candidatus Moranbacteria bacterium GW2011_GWF2_37_11]KKQ29467.1 MAG: Carbohydrate kinase [Candidatus Moranbacteria bacterium GW2011_GWD1_37_17]KKQ30665.1 MAG: Carbohydrate kinase [Candidatus Moranbacteria bacterium GW2011_GWE1_37_24]KKQ47767.1 MAG: Carbohydrate kinase [Candidatus Moranbact